MFMFMFTFVARASRPMSVWPSARLAHTPHRADGGFLTSHLLLAPEAECVPGTFLYSPYLPFITVAFRHHLAALHSAIAAAFDRQTACPRSIAGLQCCCLPQPHSCSTCFTASVRKKRMRGFAPPCRPIYWLEKHRCHRLQCTQAGKPGTPRAFSGFARREHNRAPFPPSASHARSHQRASHRCWLNMPRAAL